MTYFTNLATTINRIESHNNGQRMTKAKEQRISRLKRHLKMAVPVKTSYEEESGYNVYSISAVRDDSGWSWDNKFKMNNNSITINEETLHNSRKLLKLCRDEGWLSEMSKGKVKVDYVNGDGQIVEIINKNTLEPLIAFMANP